MKVAFVTITEPTSVRAWSGTNHGIFRALSSQEGVEVIPVGPLRSARKWLSKAKALAHRALTPSRRYLWTRDPALLRGYARHAGELLREIDYDIIFSPGTEPIAFLETDKPIVLWSDAPFAAMVDYYPWYSNLSRATLLEGAAVDTRALTRSDLVIYSSQWACDSAISGHGASPSKLRVIPFGANLSSDVTNENLASLIESRTRPPWRFLLVAVEWHRKGADIVLEVVGELNRRGYPSEMIVAGVQPSKLKEPLPPYVKLAGFFDKNSEEGRRGLRDLYRSATFYFMPSRAEATAIVYCEANSFGVPCLASKTGGTPSLVQDGVNGWCFPLDSRVEDYADHIISVINGGEYERLARNGMRISHERLNWAASGAKLRGLLAEALAARKPSVTTAENAGEPVVV